MDDHSNELQDLNFKVQPDFHRDFKMTATAIGMSMKELIEVQHRIFVNIFGKYGKDYDQKSEEMLGIRLVIGEYSTMLGEFLFNISHVNGVNISPAMLQKLKMTATDYRITLQEMLEHMVTEFPGKPPN